MLVRNHVKDLTHELLDGLIIKYGLEVQVVSFKLQTKTWTKPYALFARFKKIMIIAYVQNRTVYVRNSIFTVSHKAITQIEVIR